MIEDIFKQKLPTTLALLQNKATADCIHVESNNGVLKAICWIGGDNSHTGNPIYGSLRISLEKGFSLSTNLPGAKSVELGFKFKLSDVVAVVNDSNLDTSVLDVDYADLFISLAFLCRYAFVNDTNQERTDDSQYYKEA
tara:strand:+ start:119 stop:535 length:417 start_codon:yes stop_codon:yes gene_type:complete